MGDDLGAVIVPVVGVVAGLGILYGLVTHKAPVFSIPLGIIFRNDEKLNIGVLYAEVQKQRVIGWETVWQVGYQFL